MGFAFDKSLSRPMDLIENTAIKRLTKGRRGLNLIAKAAGSKGSCRRRKSAARTDESSSADIYIAA
jgi:hypothetical protein